ncbi:S49 family peptidase [Acetobacteraceae bacterium KSS8]|uniref:S49 family peptidase n=1 Tax=Endosaccharibacter trunci TaxID=2812733 RepID=A0ABT1WAM2_9PROT|nr:S49 family peptidase [Acetobacteraceae bacterium KSS8]
MIDGVAIIPVEGTLVQKLGTMQPACGMTSYDGIRACFLEALDDDAVCSILLDIDSPGGEVAGCLDLADEIFAARGRKPIWAMLGEVAYSGAYVIASSADRVLVPRTGSAGSVGVMTMHADFSAALTTQGINVTLITHGSHKADGNEFEPLPAEVLERIQAQIDAMGELLVRTVARYRGMTPVAVRATQAATYMGGEAVAVGFADVVASPSSVLAALSTI